MRIDPSIPAHIARAYGMKPVQAAPPRLKLAPAQAPLTPPAPRAAEQSAKPIDTLIAGRVDQPVEFDGAGAPRPNADVLQLYTRSADRVEAAIAVQIGRRIDVTG